MCNYFVNLVFVFVGFSKQMLQVLSGYKIGTFDILSDDEVRQGEKQFRNYKLKEGRKEGRKVK